MKTVLVTGAEGFIGRNLCAALKQKGSYVILPIDIGNTNEELESAADKADFVIHLAGVNRPTDIRDFDTGNRELTEVLIERLSRRDHRPPFLMSSSIQAALDNPYGISKRKAEEAVSAYGAATGAPVFIFRLPNVFGKWCRPNYNSVIATWCYNTAREIPIKIDNPDTELHLVYIDDVVEAFVATLESGYSHDAHGYCAVNVSYRKNLGQIAKALNAFASSRTTHVMPSLEEGFMRALYATWLSYLPEREFAYALDMKKDARGWLAEFIKSPPFGRIFVSITKPGITRGNHWHNSTVEKFLVVSGEACIRFRKIDTEEIIEYPVSGKELKVVDIPPGYTHSIMNTGETELITLFWSDEIYDPNRPDTNYLEV